MSDRWALISPDIRESAESGGEVTVCEAEREGRAEVTFTAPVGWRLERIALTTDFKWLQMLKAADGIVLARAPDGAWEAHIVECTKSVGDREWGKARAQLHGSRIRLDALCGVLGLRVERICLYTAFRRDKLSASASPDPVLIAIPVGSAATPASASPEQVAGRLAWSADAIDVPGFGRLPHRRVQLQVANDVGIGRVDLG